MEGKEASFLPANSVIKAAEVDITPIKDSFVPEETYLYAKVTRNGEVLSENRYFFAPYGKLHVKEADVKTEVKVLSATKAEITLMADTFVWMLHLATPDGVEYSDNDFDLLPGEKKKITVTTKSTESFKPGIWKGIRNDTACE